MHDNLSAYLGLCLLVLALIGIIIYYVLSASCSGKKIDGACETSLIINDTVESIMLATMIVASVMAYYSIGHLDVNPNPISFLDDLLLLVCLPSFLIYNTLNLLSGENNLINNYIHISYLILGVEVPGLFSTIPTNILTVSASYPNLYDFEC